MFGIRLIFLLAVLGGVIAFIADKLGSKIGKKKLRIFGLRPHDTSVLLTVLSGVLISLFSMGILAVSSESARTALFGMEKLQKELQQLNTEKGTVEEEYNKAMESLQEKNEAIAGLDLKIKESNAAQAAAEKSLQQANENLSAVQGQYQENRFLHAFLFHTLSLPLMCTNASTIIGRAPASRVFAQKPHDSFALYHR